MQHTFTLLSFLKYHKAELKHFTLLMVFPRRALIISIIIFTILSYIGVLFSKSVANCFSLLYIFLQILIHCFDFKATLSVLSRWKGLQCTKESIIQKANQHCNMYILNKGFQPKTSRTFILKLVLSFLQIFRSFVIVSWFQC